MVSIRLSLDRLAALDGSPDVSEFDVFEMRRKPIRWDKITKVTHDTNCGQNINCALNAFVWNGVVLREEQTGNYAPPNDPDIPDRNPRGCQKGVAFAHRMYDPQRIKYPLKRVGDRGGGRWQRISWDQALTEIADKMLDVLMTDGCKSIVNGGGTQGEYGSSVDRTFWGTLTTRLGNHMPLINSEIGDDHQGALEMLGNSSVGSGVEDWYLADMIVFWAVNPASSIITNYHYFTEARYNGTKIVTIAPDYNPSCVQADEWIPVKPATDAALGLGMSQVIVEEGLYKEDFIKEQTDLPLLVRSDTGKFLRQSDVQSEGKDYIYYIFDQGQRQVTEAPHKSLSLEGLDPALEGEFEVKTLRGTVKVRPVLDLLKEMLDREYRPEKAAEICGVNPETIRRFAREFARAGGVVNPVSYAVGKFYHGNLMERAMIYNWALCGHIGRKGANYNAQGGAFMREPAQGKEMPQRLLLQAAPMNPRNPEWQDRNFSDYRILKEMVYEMIGRMAQPVSLLWYFHSGLLDLSKKHNSWDTYLKRDVGEYVEEALASGTRLVYPAPDKDPKALFVWGGDPLRRVRANQYVVDTLIPKLDLFVTMDWRWSSSARYSDYVLPSCGYYERTTARLVAGFFQPIGHFTFQATKPLYESRSDWWIGVKLLRRLAERARERDISSIKDPDTGLMWRVDAIDEAITASETYTEDDEEPLVQDLYTSSVNIEQLPWDDVKERGWVNFTSPGLVLPFSADFAGDLEPGEPAIPLTVHTQKKEHYHTATGRIQFYIDHDWYLELGEAFACHKDAPKAGGDYPLVLSGAHGRWSMHTLWSENALMLQLQRGEPVAFVSDADARDRGIRDGDLVEVSNDVGSFQIKAVVTARLPRGMACIHHIWTNAQFRDGKHFQHVMPSPFNPLEFAPATFADYPNVASDGWAGDPGGNDRDTRVEIRKV